MTERADPNASDQKKAWNGAMGERWLANHQRLHTMIKPFSESMLGMLTKETFAAAPDPNAANPSAIRVLDVGCGTGETTVMTSERLEAIGVEASVRGADISALLIDHAMRTHWSEKRDFVVADAGEDDLGGIFDVIVSRCGTMFFAEPEQAFRHLRSHLVSGGQLLMTVWQNPELNEWVRVPLGAAKPYVNLPGPPPVGAPGPFSLADGDRLLELLDVAGFESVEMKAHTSDLLVGHDPVDAARFLLGVLPTGPLLDSMDDVTTELVVQAVAEDLDLIDGHVTLQGVVWSVSATNP